MKLFAFIIERYFSILKQLTSHAGYIGGNLQVRMVYIPTGNQHGVEFNSVYPVIFAWPDHPHLFRSVSPTPQLNRYLVFHVIELLTVHIDKTIVATVQ